MALATEETGLTRSQKIAATIIGALVIIFAVFLVVGSIRLVKRLQGGNTTSSSTKTAVSETNVNTPVVSDSTVVRTDSPNYQTMPSTGPMDGVMMFLVGTLILSTCSIAVTKKIL
jgi:TRAP-type C4-dicarboxylate transport system permease small subunit